MDGRGRGQSWGTKRVGLAAAEADRGGDGQDKSATTSKCSSGAWRGDGLRAGMLRRAIEWGPRSELRGRGMRGAGCLHTSAPHLLTCRDCYGPGDARSVRLPMRSLIPRHTARQGALEVKPTWRVVPEMTRSHDGQGDPPRARSRPCRTSAHTSLLSRAPKRFSVLSPTHTLEQLLAPSLRPSPAPRGQVNACAHQPRTLAPMLGFCLPPVQGKFCGSREPSPSSAWGSAG